jgi:hypothetical protein
VNAIAVFSEEIGLKDYEENVFNVYPNPFNDEIYISNAHYVRNVKIISVLGGVFHVKPSRGNSNIHVNLSNLDNGIYFIVVETNNGKQVTKKIVK